MEGVIEPDQEPAQDSPQSLLGSDFENVFDVCQFVSKNYENHEDKVHKRHSECPELSDNNKVNRVLGINHIVLKLKLCVLVTQLRYLPHMHINVISIIFHCWNRSN